MRVPLATYRLQFNRGFRFQDARQLVPYLEQLGISHVYASPILQARRGSTHGYDVTNPLRLNPELGPATAFDRLARELQQRRMGLLLDIVPNHMAASSENPWYMDVIEQGAHSRYAPYFDIDWRSRYAPLVGKILVPILGVTYGKALESGQLVLKLDAAGFALHYHATRLPLAPRSYAAVLAHRRATFRARAGAHDPAFVEYRGLIRLARHLGDKPWAAPEAMVEDLKTRLWRLYRTRFEIREFIDATLRELNGRAGDPLSFNLLDRLLTEQNFWLTYWRLANEHINYRRFFAISELISVRMEDEQVFRATHALILRLVREGKVDALRVDHIDGLYDPAKYLSWLRRAFREERQQADTSAARFGAGEAAAAPAPALMASLEDGRPGDLYVLVEKILGQAEELPSTWPVAGTTGYDFLAALNSMFVDSRGLRDLGVAYARLIGREIGFHDLVYEKKKLTMQTLFAGEMSSLGDDLARLAAQDRHARDLPPRLLQDSLTEITACFSVYRTYIDSFDVSAHDAAAVEQGVSEARRRNPAGSVHVFDFLRRLLLLEGAAEGVPPLDHAAAIERLNFVMRWQQFTGPIMAKGVEDTTLYIYNRLLSQNEVGSDPTVAGGECNVFHRLVRARQQRWPHTMNATTTHDTKRGEDVRARINVLSELPKLWERRAERWMRWNGPLRSKVMNRPVPDANDEVHLYQTMLGAWPLDSGEAPASARPAAWPMLGPRVDARPGADDLAAFRDRLLAYVIKAAREARVHTSWLKPNPEYESAFQTFVARLFEPGQARFMSDFLRFARTVACYGAWNGLAQVLLKIACPGVPDFYQGSELWDLRLVDPDNRAPVDFARRMNMLARLKQRSASASGALAVELVDHWPDGRIKLYVIWKALSFRRQNRALFEEGEYLPLGARGRRKENVCAFARRGSDSWAIPVVPRLLTALLSPGEPPTGRRVWGNSVLNLPEEAPREWRDVFTGRTLAAPRRGKKVLALADVFAVFPVALLAAAD